MKKLIIFVLSLFLISCSSDSESEKLDYKNEMRNFVIGISEYAKNPNDADLVKLENYVLSYVYNTDLLEAWQRAYPETGHRQHPD